MNEELQIARADVITSALSTAEQAKGFLAAELPDVVQQLLWWRAAESGLLFLTSIALALGVIYGWRRWAIPGFGERDGYERLNLFGMALVASVVPISVAICIFNIAWLQIIIAPKVYLLEYAAHLAKGAVS